MISNQYLAHRAQAMVVAQEDWLKPARNGQVTVSHRLADLPKVVQHALLQAATKRINREHAITKEAQMIIRAAVSRPRHIKEKSQTIEGDTVP